MGNNKHLDCRNYAPVDVAKGICHARKFIVLTDEDGCESFERAPRCKYCSNFIQGSEEHLGTCEAVRTRPMTYPALSGVTCEWFAWRQA